MPNDESSRAAPAIAVTLPANLVRLFPGAVRRLELPASSVREMIDALDARWPGMRDRLCDSRPTIRRHISVRVAAPHWTPPLRPGPKWRS